MLKFVTLICALFGILTAVSLESWLRNRIRKSDSVAEAYPAVRSRNTEFWSIQYLPLFIITAVIAAAIYAGIGRSNAAVFVMGAVLCFVSVFVGSRTTVSGSLSSASLALSGDIRSSLRASYRSASVMGLVIVSIALTGLGVLFFILDTEHLIRLIASFALGASVTSFCLGLSGTSFSGAYALNVKKDDFTDYTGSFIGSGADLAESYILSACAASLLSGVAVDTSGVMSTFTAGSAVKFPFTVLAAGIVACIVGIMTYRGRIVRNPAAGVTAGNFISAALIIAVAVYFSHELLQSYVYSFCVAAGIAASLISGEILKLYSSYGAVFKKYVPDAKSVGVSQSMIYSLSIGMISIIIPVFLSFAAMIVSYYFANFYGIALAAVGINSMTAINAAVRGFSINTASASEIVSLSDPDAESPNPADVLLTASAGTDIIGKTISAVSTAVTLVAMFTALSVVAGNQVTDLLSTSVFTGLAIGAVFAFVCAGLIIRSIRLTGVVVRRKQDSPDEDVKISNLRGLIPLYIIAPSVPLAAGLLGGVNGMVAFAFSASITGMCIIFTFNDSGRYFDRVAIETLGTVIKLMVAVTLVCAPAFISFGGLF